MQDLQEERIVLCVMAGNTHFRRSHQTMQKGSDKWLMLRFFFVINNHLLNINFNRSNVIITTPPSNLINLQ